MVKDEVTVRLIQKVARAAFCIQQNFSITSNLLLLKLAFKLSGSIVQTSELHPTTGSKNCFDDIFKDTCVARQSTAMAVL